MDNTRSFELKDLYKTGNFNEIINICEGITQGEEFNEWDYFYYISSLRKIKEYKKALMLGKHCKVKYPQFKNVDVTLCWCLYYLHIKDFKGTDDSFEENKFYKVVDAILNNCGQDKYSPYTLAVWKAVDNLFSKNNIDYNRIDYYISKLDVNLLDMEPKLIEADGKRRELASDKEKWYVKKGKALFSLGKYEECIEILREALKNISKTHNDNDLWFLYRIALCYMALNELDTAEDIINKCLKLKEHWCLYEKLFEIYSKEGDLDKAFKYASTAALSIGEHKHKIGLYEKFAVLLKENNKHKEAYYHLFLCKKIREENGWKLDSKLVQMLNEYEEEEIEYKNLIKDLSKFWREAKLKGEKIYKGIIDKILPNNKAGFIKGEDNNSYYFRMISIINGRKNLNIGGNVSFYTKESYDKSKNRVSQEAVEITIL